MFIDAHAHVGHCCRNGPLEDCFGQAARELSYLVEISTNTEEILNLSGKILPDNVILAAGLYPDQSPRFDPSMKNGFLNAVKTLPRPLKALGEVGIDLHWKYATLKEQEVLFRDQIGLSLEWDLPLIVHSRDAFDDTMRILSDFPEKTDVILHCFGYGPREAEEFLSRGYTLSFAGNLTYPNARGLHDAARLVPLDRLLLETDSPYLAPVPVRGRPNVPANVKYTYEFLAGLRNLAVGDLAERIGRNFQAVFRI